MEHNEEKKQEEEEEGYIIEHVAKPPAKEPMASPAHSLVCVEVEEEKKAASPPKRAKSFEEFPRGETSELVSKGAHKAAEAAKDVSDFSISHIAVEVLKELPEPDLPKDTPEYFRAKCNMWREVCDLARNEYRTQKHSPRNIPFWEQPQYQQIKAIENEIEEIYSMICGSEREHDKVHTQIDTVKKENQKLMEDMEKKVKSLQDIQAKYGEIAGFGPQLAQLDETCDKVVKWYTEASEKVNKIFQEKFLLRQLHEKAILELRVAHKRKVEVENSTHQTQIEEHKERIKELENKRKKLTEQRESLLSKIAALGIEPGTSAPTDKDQLQAKLKESEDGNKKLLAELNNIQETIDSIKALATKFKARIQEVIESNKEKQVEEFEANLQKLQTAYANSQKLKEQLIKENEALFQQLNSLDINTKQLDSEIAQETMKAKNYAVKLKEPLPDPRQIANKKEEMNKQISKIINQLKELSIKGDMLEKIEEELHRKELAVIAPPVLKKPKWEPKKVVDKGKTISELQKEYAEIVEKKKQETERNKKLKSQWEAVQVKNRNNADIKKRIIATETEITKRKGTLKELQDMLRKLGK